MAMSGLQIKRADPALLRLLFFLGGLIAVLVVLIVFRKIFQPLLLGLLLAYLFDPAVSWFEARGRSRTFAVILLALLLSILIIGILVFAIPEAGDQLEDLSDRLPEYGQRIRASIEPWFDRIEARFPEEVGEIQARVVDWLRENLPQVATKLTKGLQNIFTNVFDTLLFLLNLIFVPVFAFYLLVDFPKVKAGISSMIPIPFQEVTLARIREVDQAISSFLRGQLTIAIILALINGTGLALLGVPFGFVIGAIAGLANMIPYMSLIVGLLPGVLLCWAEFQSIPMALAVVAIFSGAQLLEGTVLSPKILSKSVNLHPVWVLLALIAGGSLFGFFGMLIAVPTAAAIQVFASHWIDLYRSSKLYQEADATIDDDELEASAKAET